METCGDPRVYRVEKHSKSDRRLLDLVGVTLAIALIVINWGIMENRAILELLFKGAVIWIIPTQLYWYGRNFKIPRTYLVWGLIGLMIVEFFLTFLP